MTMEQHERPLLPVTSRPWQSDEKDAQDDAGL